MEAIASTLKSENDIYIGTIIDQILTFNQHSIQLLSGLIDYAESRNSRFLKKEDAVFIDHVSKNEGLSMFSTKTRKKVSSKMKSRATSRQSRIILRNRKKEQNTKECLKIHLEQMFHYFLQIYPRLIEEIKFLDFENYFPVCKEIMTFFVNYVKLFHLKKYMYKPQEFISFRDYSKTFIRLVTPFIEKVTPIITEYLSYDPKINDKRFDWDSIDINSDYSPYKKNSSLYKFETNVLINFREVIDWIICILALINTKKIVKEDSKTKKNQTIDDKFQFPEKFQPLLELIKQKNIHFNIADDFRKNPKQLSKKKLKKQIENEQQKAKEEKLNMQVQQITKDKTNEKKTKENTKTKNLEQRKTVKKNEKEQIDSVRYTPDFLLPQNAYDFIDNYYVFLKEEKDQDKNDNDKEKEKADKKEEEKSKKSKNKDNDNKDNESITHYSQIVMLNCALNSILPMIRQKNVNLYFNIPKALSALGLSSFEIMREFQDTKPENDPYKNNELMLNISLVLSCVVSFIQASEDITQTFFNFVCERTCPLLYKIADSSSVNSDITTNVLEAVYAVINIVMDSKMSVHKQIQNQIAEKDYDVNNIYFSLISVRISLIRILYCFLYLQSQSQLIGAFQMVQLLSQFYFNSNLIDNIEDLLMNITKVDKLAFMLCNPLKFFNKALPDFPRFNNCFFPAEIIPRSVNFAFYNPEFGSRLIYLNVDEYDDKLSLVSQNFNTLIELNKKVLKRLITYIITNIKENKDKDKNKDKNKDNDNEQNKNKKKAKDKDKNNDNDNDNDNDSEKKKGKEKNKDPEKEKEKQTKILRKENEIRRYYSNRALALIDELGYELISPESKGLEFVDFHELTKKAIRRAMRLQANKRFIEDNKKENQKKEKGKEKKEEKNPNETKEEAQKRKEEEKKRKEEEEKKRKEEEKRRKEIEKKRKEEEKKKKEEDGKNGKDNAKKIKPKRNNETIAHFEFINGDNLCKFIFNQLNFFAPSFYRNGYFIDVIRCCIKHIKSFYFNYFIGIENGTPDPIFNSIIEISKVIELLHPETVSEIVLNLEDASMRQKIMDLVNEVVSMAVNKLNMKNVNKKNKVEIDEFNTKQIEILKIGRAHHFRQLLNVAVKMSWRHSDPTITTNYGMLRNTTKCGISLHPGNDENMFSMSTSSREQFEEHFPKLICNILTKENFFNDEKIFFDTEKLCYPKYEYFPNGILYALCATYFHSPFEKRKGTESERIHEMTKSVFRLINEKIYNDQMELLAKPEIDYNLNFIKLSRIQYRAYYFLGLTLKLSPVLTNHDVEGFYSPYLFDEAIKFLSKYDTEDWHKKEEEEEKSKKKDKIDRVFRHKHKNIRYRLDKFISRVNEKENDMQPQKEMPNIADLLRKIDSEEEEEEEKGEEKEDLQSKKEMPSIDDLLRKIDSEEREEETNIEKIMQSSKKINIGEEIVEEEEEKEKGEEIVEEEEEKEIVEEEEEEKEKEIVEEEEEIIEDEKEKEKGEEEEEKQEEKEKEKEIIEEEEKGEEKEDKKENILQSKSVQFGFTQPPKEQEPPKEQTRKKKILSLEQILEEENQANRDRYYRNFDEGNYLFRSTRIVRKSEIKHQPPQVGPKNESQKPAPKVIIEAEEPNSEGPPTPTPTSTPRKTQRNSPEDGSEIPYKKVPRERRKTTKF